jgi:hypothetical protein
MFPQFAGAQIRFKHAETNLVDLRPRRHDQMVQRGQSARKGILSLEMIRANTDSIYFISRLFRCWNEVGFRLLRYG